MNLSRDLHSKKKLVIECSRKRCSRQGNSRCKGSDMGMSMECSRHSQEASVVGGGGKGEVRSEMWEVARLWRVMEAAWAVF